MVTLQEVESWLSYVADKGGKLSAVVLLLLAFYRGVLKPLSTWIWGAGQIIAKLDDVVKQLSPNGGTSLRDAIDRIEHRQAVAEQRSRALLLEAPYGIWETNAHGHCIWANRTYCKLVGKSLEELKGQGWESCIHPDDRERVIREWESCVEHRREFAMEFDYLSHDRNRVPVLVKAYPLIDAKNKVKGWVGTSLTNFDPAL